MRKLFFSCLFFVVLAGQAQDDIYKTIAKETCDCIAKRNIDAAKRAEVEMALGLCMLESINAHKIDIEVSDETAMAKFGEQVGMQMAPICPTVFNAFIESEEETQPEIFELSGTVKSIESGEFLYVIFKEVSGKEHKLLWFRYFPGSDDFKDNPKGLIGKKATVYYHDIECYFPKMKAYYNTKEIVELKLN
jgi:hypothetical protein